MCPNVLRVDSSTGDCSTYLESQPCKGLSLLLPVVICCHNFLRLCLGFFPNSSCLCQDFIWCGFSWDFFMLSLLGVHIHKRPAILKTLFPYDHPLQLALKIFLLPFPQWSLNLRRKNFDVGVIFRDNHSAYWSVPMVFCIYHYLLHKKSSLVIVERCINL